MDENSGVPKILRHNLLRFIGFGIYFILLLFKLKSMDFDELLIPLQSTETVILLIVIIVVSQGLSYLIYYFYLKKPFQNCDSTSSESAQ